MTTTSSATRLLFLLTLGACSTTQSTNDKPVTADTAAAIVPLHATRWVLDQVAGQPLPSSFEDNRFPYLRLSTTDSSRVVGNAGCNHFGGSYTATDGGQLSFTGVFATKMFCANMETENQFMRVLSQTSRYRIQGDTLLLLNATDAPALARLHVAR